MSKKRFRRGDKIAIPRTKSCSNTNISDFPLIANAKSRGIKFMYFSSYQPRNVGEDACFISFGGEKATRGAFYESDLKRYVENKKGW